jgi:hypothetical protein
MATEVPTPDKGSEGKMIAIFIAVQNRSELKIDARYLGDLGLE